jgi:T5SS/PEP-CTERM-associated repeat protein/autotransporter-associated beta strand protein
MLFFNSCSFRGLAVVLLFATAAPVDLRADTILDSGTVTVTTGTDFGNSLIVGSTGTAALKVLVGGSTTKSSSYLGYNAGSNGTATVAGGTWANWSLNVGHEGFGTLNLDGGLVTTNGFIVGFGTASYGITTVSSGRLENNGHLWVGYYGDGDVVVNGGNVVTSGGGSWIAYLLRSRGSVTVSSGTWDSLDLVVGSQGNGSLIVNGGYVTSFYGTYLGAGSEAIGTASVSSGTWATGGSLYFGGPGTGVLNLSGGSVASGSAVLGYDPRFSSSTGLAVVSGGTWTNSGNLHVGVDDSASSTGTLTISGGLVTVGGTLSRGSLGTINLNAGGTLQIGTGGTTGVLGVSTLANNGTLIFNRSDASTYSGVLSGSGGLTKDGVGTLTLTGSNGLAGPTIIRKGKLNLGNPTALASSAITPLSGGTLTLVPYLRTSVGGLNPNAGGLIDVGNGMVTVAAGLSAGQLVTAIDTGRGDGSWNGTSGITSSVAAASNGDRTVGWLDNGDGSVSFAFAAAGDTNLDWRVDILDAANFLSGGKFDTGSPASWNEGDFTYDGVVDILDAASFLSTGLFDAGAYNTPPLQATIAVPEPSTYAMALAGLACGGYSMWRRRKQA